MPRELLRLPYSIAELVLLEYPGEMYRIEIYWRDGSYYERLIEVRSFELAHEAILKVAEQVLIYIFLTSLSLDESKKGFLKFRCFEDLT